MLRIDKAENHDERRGRGRKEEESEGGKNSEENGADDTVRDVVGYGQAFVLKTLLQNQLFPMESRWAF